FVVEGAEILVGHRQHEFGSSRLTPAARHVLTAAVRHDITPGVPGSTNTLGRLLRAGARVDRTQVQSGRGARYGLGVGMPLVAGVALHRPIEGVAVSVGAVLVGLTDSGAPYARRTGEMMLATAGATVSMYVGQLVGAHDGLTVGVVALW